MSRFAALWLFFPCALTAQTPASVERAASSLRADDIRRRIGLLADDSMRGRSTPSPELEKAASWIAAEFRRFGLRSGGDSGTYFQRYPIVRKALDTAETFLTVSRSGHGSVALEAGNDLSVRVFVDAFGVPEDAATGSGNGCLAAYLSHYKYFQSEEVDAKVDQGHEIGRPSRIYLDAREEEGKLRVSVGGRVMSVGAGKFG